jgi:hypothetical protein
LGYDLFGGSLTEYLKMTECAELVEPNDQVLKEAIAALAAAKTDIDELTELLGYFANLGDSSTLRDFREVRANLLRSRALLSTQNDLVADLTRVATSLAELLGVRETMRVDDLGFGLSTSPTPHIAVAPPHVPAQQNQQTMVNSVFTEMESVLRTSN